MNSTRHYAHRLNSFARVSRSSPLRWTESGTNCQRFQPSILVDCVLVFNVDCVLFSMHFPRAACHMSTQIHLYSNSKLLSWGTELSNPFEFWHVIPCVRHPDMTFTVDRALKTNYLELSIIPCDCLVLPFPFLAIHPVACTSCGLLLLLHNRVKTPYFAQRMHVQRAHTCAQQS